MAGTHFLGPVSSRNGFTQDGAPVLALLGTSITDQGSKNVQPPEATPSRSWYTDGYATWLRVLTDQRINLPVENDFGNSGDTLANMLARVGSVINARPAACIVEGGSNDFTVNTYASIKQGWLAIVNAIRNAGITVIVIPAPPRAGSVLTAAQLATQLRFYNFQREFCRSNRGVIFCDYMGYWLDQTSATSAPLANRVKTDNLHPIATGAYWMAKPIVDVINQLYPPMPTDICAAADIYDGTNNPTGTLLYNATNNRSTMAGTGGTATASTGLTYVNNGLAAGWTLIRSGTSTCTVTLSKEDPRTDTGRMSGERQVIQIAATSGGGSDEVYNLRFTPALADVAQEEWYYAECGIEVTGAPVNCNALELYLLETRPTNSQTAVDMAFNTSASGFMPTETWKGVYRTPPIKRTAEATALQVNVRARMKTDVANANITFKVGDFVVRKNAI